jgi:hypothetical protein
VSARGGRRVELVPEALVRQSVVETPKRDQSLGIWSSSGPRTRSRVRRPLASPSSDAHDDRLPERMRRADELLGTYTHVEVDGVRGGRAPLARGAGAHAQRARDRNDKENGHVAKFSGHAVDKDGVSRDMVRGIGRLAAEEASEERVHAEVAVARRRGLISPLKEVPRREQSRLGGVGGGVCF